MKAVRTSRKLHLFLLLSLLVFPGCSQKKEDSPRQPEASSTVPPATPGLELQAEDYAKVRSTFRTKLTRKIPAPQRWRKVRVPKDAAEVEYRSGDLRLKAWVSRPRPGLDRKLPAVLYLHGGWAFGEDDWEQAQPLRDAGFVVMVPILRGENGQPGHFTMFYDEVDDALAAATHLASLEWVDPSRLYVAGHSAGGTLAMLAAMTTDRFRAAASLSGSPDRIDFVRGWDSAVTFDKSDIREFRVRSPVAYAGSFKCPARLYVASEDVVHHDSTRRTALLARDKGLDVDMVIVPGDHDSAVPESLRQAIAFFRQHEPRR
jgi:dipeptidyl aminopeptidase/acylaminoacyl peptidase